jgi:hypothetical protein
MSKPHGFEQSNLALIAPGLGSAVRLGESNCDGRPSKRETATERQPDRPFRLRKTKGLATTSLLTLVILGRGGGIRTRDPLHPMQVRYQAALRPD